MRLRYADKKDANDATITEALRKAGYSVLDLTGVGAGAPDKLICRGTLALLLELKTEAGRLSARQKEWIETWAGAPVLLAKSPEQALSAMDFIFQKLASSTGGKLRTMRSNGTYLDASAILENRRF